MYERVSRLAAGTLGATHTPAIAPARAGDPQPGAVAGRHSIAKIASTPDDAPPMQRMNGAGTAAAAAPAGGGGGDDDDWADFANAFPVQVGIGAISEGLTTPLSTTGLGDCVAVVGYSPDGRVAAMAHVNIPAQCYSLHDQDDWDDDVAEYRAQYVRVRDTIANNVIGTVDDQDDDTDVAFDDIRWAIVFGSVWRGVLNDPETYANGDVYQGKMRTMLADVFPGVAFRGYGATATWAAGTLTPS